MASAELNTELHLLGPDEKPSGLEAQLLTHGMTMDEVNELLDKDTTPKDLLVQLHLRIPYLESKLNIIKSERVPLKVIGVLADSKKIIFDDGTTGQDYLYKEIDDPQKGPDATSPRFNVLRRLLNREFGITEVSKQNPTAFPRR